MAIVCFRVDDAIPGSGSKKRRRSGKSRKKAAGKARKKGRKKGRTAAQKAATRKMIAANKRARRKK